MGNYPCHPSAPKYPSVTRCFFWLGTRLTNRLQHHHDCRRDWQHMCHGQGSRYISLSQWALRKKFKHVIPESLQFSHWLSEILGMVISPLIGIPYNGYIKPYCWVDDHPLTQGTNGSLDPIAHMGIKHLQLFIFCGTRNGCST